MIEEMPTITELKERIGVDYNSVAYGQSKTVLGNQNQKVLGYGIGFAGFIAIYKDKRGFPHAVTYTAKHLLGNYPDAGFITIDIQKGINHIKNNALMVERRINEDEVEIALDKQRFARPLLGTMELTKNSMNSWRGNSIDTKTCVYNIYRLKNKKLRIESDNNYGNGFSKIDNEEFIHHYKRASAGVKVEFKVGKDNDDEYSILTNTIPEDVVTEINDMIVEKAI